jgi:hypothetical protein
MTDAYTGLKALVRNRFKGNDAAVTALEKHERKPDAWRDALKDELQESGAADDKQLLDQAAALMAFVDVRGTREGKYTVTIVDSTNPYVGDGGSQINYVVIDRRRQD